MRPVQERPQPMSLADAAAWTAEFGGTPELMDLIERRTSPAGAVALARLLWPVFVVEQGCVLIEGHYTPEGLTQWLHQTNADIPAVEAVLSHVHLWDLFAQDPADDAVNAVLLDLLQVMAATWRYALAQAFPDRQFVVDATPGDDGHDDGPTLAFHSIPPPVVDAPEPLLPGTDEGVFDAPEIPAGFGLDFPDLATGIDTRCGIRPVEGGVGLTLSTRSGADLEVVLSPTHAGQIAHALLAAAQQASP
jgi:hypothetical protein